jgi:L-ascorbate metabolism protein UlaG (beta-lactamase superfamily)
MKITKFAHACVLVETPDRVGLFDPGNYSWESGTFDIEKLEKLDDILITHQHPDHMYLPFITALIAKFPNVSITTTEGALEELKSKGITNVSTVESDVVSLFRSDHEPMEPLASPPQVANTGIHYLNMISHPGDSHHFDETKTVLALPICAPWGITARAAAIITELQPQYVLPIHDWLWRDEIRLKFYERFSEFCKDAGATFLTPEDGKPIEI